VARKTGVRVEEFGWGLPPKLWGKKIGETEYSINWLPFGGFVKLTGEDFDEEASRSTEDDPRSFVAKKPIQRIGILISGVVMNLILAIIVYYGMFFLTNFSTMTLPLFYDYSFKFGHQENINTVVMNFVEGSPAEEVGVEVGEAIIEVDGKPVYSVPDIRAAVEGKAGQEIQLLLMDIRSVERTFRSVRATPILNEEGEVRLGVGLVPGFTLSYGDKLLSAPQHAMNMLSYTTTTLVKLTRESVAVGDISPLSDSVAGPVGVFGAIEGILSYSAKEAAVGLLDLIAFLSLSLALINILPFPALDGGRLVFVLYEVVRGERVNPKIEGMAHRWGMLALLVLIISITVKDIKNLL
jgi:regulator of sigma E protease